MLRIRDFSFLHFINDGSRQQICQKFFSLLLFCLISFHSLIVNLRKPKEVYIPEETVIRVYDIINLLKHGCCSLHSDVDNNGDEKDQSNQQSQGNSFVHLIGQQFLRDKGFDFLRECLHNLVYFFGVTNLGVRVNLSAYWYDSNNKISPFTISAK